MIERLFYRLPELTERWTCTVDDLLHLGIRDGAQICVNVYGLARAIKYTRMEWAVVEFQPEDDWSSEQGLAKIEAAETAFNQWKARTNKGMPPGVYELAPDTLRFLEMPEAFPHELQKALKFDGDALEFDGAAQSLEGGWWECNFDPPVAIGLSHLCMLHQEVVRLDREEFGITSQALQVPAATKVPAWPTHETKKLTALRLAAAKFWSNYDPTEPDTAPKSKEVAAWLQEKHDIGATPAAEMASILRPESLRTGPR